MKSTEIKDIVNSRILKTVKLPIEFENCDNPIIFKLLNSSLEKRHQRKQLLLPNFENTDTVAIFQITVENRKTVNTIHILLYL